jgi:hypothetical protein
MKAATLHQQFGQARNGRRDASCFVRRQVAVAERPFLQVVAAMNSRQSKSVRIADFVAVRPGLFDAPKGRKSAFWGA